MTLISLAQNNLKELFLEIQETWVKKFSVQNKEDGHVIYFDDLNSAVKFFNGECGYFDVARWTKTDIHQAIIESEEYNEFRDVLYLDTGNLVENVVEHLHQVFDASIGINWDVINLAVESEVKDEIERIRNESN